MTEINLVCSALGQERCCVGTSRAKAHDQHILSLVLAGALELARVNGISGELVDFFDRGHILDIENASGYHDATEAPVLQRACFGIMCEDSPLVIIFISLDVVYRGRKLNVWQQVEVLRV